MRKFFYFLVVCTGIGVVGMIGFAIYVWDYYDGSGPLPAQATVIFKKGKGFQAIVDDLAQQGVIDHPLLFKAIAVVLGDARTFKAGEYHFTVAVTPHQVMEMIAAGKVVPHKITIPEGLMVREVLQILKNESALEGDVPAMVPEGSVLPETYRFIYGEQRQDVLRQMQSGMTLVMDGLWKNRKAGLPFETPQQALTLASIVEKETGVPEERGHVASVFINRLRIGMRLQSDPTVAYGAEQALGKPLGRSLTTGDLQAATPYNTYVIAGLPPGPIANPGRAAIEAVLNPPDSKDLYFVATGTGGHYFASSLEQHNRNVAQYRRKIDSR
jgi:UPF0755 protein